MLKGNQMTPEQLAAMEEISQMMASGKEEEVQKGWSNFFMATQESLKESFMSANGDKQVLAQRGFRQLTSKETEFYNKLIEAGKSNDPKQAMTGLLDIMPETIVEDVYRNLTEEHPLLSRINFQNVSYLTKWIINDHTKQSAVWGAINSEITEQITSGFRTISITQCKLSAFAVIEKDMLDLGPAFLDAYIRTFLKEALLDGLESAIITGSGKDMPIGLDRDIHEGVSVTGGEYPKKTAIKVKDFQPATYGDLLSKLAKSEKNRMRKFAEVTMICNMTDYLKKVMPATTVMTAQGTYAKDLFPFPTNVEVSNEMEEGKAIICLPEEYFMGVGTSKEGTIEYTDDLKFLEDQRVFKIKMHGMGKAFDNTVSILIDISELEPAYISILDKTPTTPEV